jgi:ADP-heptose:LPS heptosyltransferase
VTKKEENNSPVHILVTRLSALGDVAMTIPVIHSLALQYPEHTFTVVSMPLVAPLFKGLPNVDFVAFEKKNRHKGWIGIWHLYRDLRGEKIDCMADLHDVLRTKLLRFLFSLGGVRVAIINKGRKEKKMLVKNGFKGSQPLKSSIERYKTVFSALGLNTPDKLRTIIYSEQGDAGKELDKLFGHKTGKWIGIAPFAKHKGKQLPLEKIEKLIIHYNKQPETTVFVFGAGKDERLITEQWQQQYEHVISVANRFEIDRELLLMKRLDIMLTMDSSNMHLASSVGIRVISVWGATHPYAGFYGLNQPSEYAVQQDLDCRPCSIFGNKPCRFGTYECLTSIEPDAIIAKIDHNL